MQCLNDEQGQNAVDIQVAMDELARFKVEIEGKSKEIARLKDEIQGRSEEVARLKEGSRQKDELVLESHREAESYKKDAARLQEEVQAKTAQVKQYKKQIDSLQQGHSTGQQQQQLTSQHQHPQTQGDSEEIEKVCASEKYVRALLHTLSINSCKFSSCRLRWWSTRAS